ncbi:DinB family protein [Streptomyces sp. KMM 9044]|uniref:DinB family protein n=1 Tax=Streptomyces sp. KMM 9044 TaxID=2744474 RepID=UPI002151C42D|nr:DinB family protein [Streptomyces sp. KMM 9044]WAX78750.1 DinB family protein [Streptomyces sp. KMM 9044]
MVTHVPAEPRGDERGALLASIEEQRGGVRRSVLGLTDEQAASRPSVSELSPAGLLKHVAEMEQGWVARARGEPPAVHRDESNGHECFLLVGDETVESFLASYGKVAAETESFLRAVPSLDGTFLLARTSWNPKDERLSMRWLCSHLIREAARHAGHADIVRESLDGATAFELVA